MRRSTRNLSRTQMLYDLAIGEVVTEAMNPRYTQMPSYELNQRRPCLDEGAEDHARVIRKATMKDGVSFCEPIQPDSGW